MKKQAAMLLLLAFCFSFITACNAYTPGPVTTRSQAAPVPVGPDEIAHRRLRPSAHGFSPRASAAGSPARVAK